MAETKSLYLLRHNKVKEPFKRLRYDKPNNLVVYVASFWDGEKQRYDIIECHDRVVQSTSKDGSKYTALANTAPNVSYYSELMKGVQYAP